MTGDTNAAPASLQYNPRGMTHSTNIHQRGLASMMKVRHYTGALAAGYPNEYWNCNVCNQRNQADHFYCEGCRMRRLPLPGTIQDYNQKLSSGVLWAFHPMNKVRKEYDEDDTGIHRRHHRHAHGHTTTNGEISEVSEVEEDADENVKKDAELVWQLEAPEPPKQWCDLDQDTVQTVMSFFQGLLNLYKVVMGCFLVIFVTQECTFDGITSECSLEENLRNTDTPHLIVLGFNGAAAISTVIFLFSVKYREAELIINLDEDQAVTNDFLVRPNDEKVRVFDFYPNIRDVITKLNRNVYFMALFTAVIYLVNVVVSAIQLFAYASAGSSTFTSFFGFVSLNMTLQWDYCMTMRASYTTNIAYSLLKKDPAVFNSIDKDLKIKEYKKIETK